MSYTKTYAASDELFLKGGGEMGQLIRDHDWSKSGLGAPGDWPQSLKTTVSILLHARFPMFLWWGPDLICFYNDAYRPSLGVDGKHPSILGMPAIDAWPEIWDFIEPLIRQVLSGSGSVYNEDLLLPIFRNGKMEDVYWTFSYSPVRDEIDSIAGVLVTCHETTEKVKMVQYLRESERRFQRLIENASVGIMVLSGEEMVVEIANSAYGRLIGRTPSELLGRPLFDVIPETAAEFRPLINKVLTDGLPLFLFEHPYKVFLPNGEINGYVNVVHEPYRELSGEITGVMALCQDVTPQVAAKHLMETALEQLRLSKEAAQLGMFDMDLVKNTMEWDPRCRDLFGISHGNKVTYEYDFVDGLHPDDRDRIVTLITKLLSGPDAGGDYDVEYRTVGAEDRRIRWVRAKGKVYFDGQDRATRFIGSVLDITLQKINEQRKNDFIAMVSHELKTPLTSLTAYIQLLLRESGDKPGSLESNILTRAGVQTRKMTGIINGFLNVSRLETGQLELKFTTFALDDLVKQEMADLSIGQTDITLEFECGGQIIVNADREKIGAVINNLISNAIKYSLRGKKIRVNCVICNNDVIVSITDQGIGIKPDELPHVFNRFYRVENENAKDISGFGIGLYLSAEIIKFHQGKIWVESEFGKGSTFYFSIPMFP